MTKPRALLVLLALTVPFVGTGCITHAVRVEPITLAPIQMTIDVNVHGETAAATTTGADDGALDAAPTAPASTTP